MDERYLAPTVLARAQDTKTSHRLVEKAVRSAARGKRLVLAVSGGRDSMVMLRAAAISAHDSVAIVATFDHGTGPAAARAAALVSREAAALGFPVVVGRAPRRAGTEAEWREMRLAFLRDVAGKCDALVTTAHTRDDQVETVLMRVLRGTGPRGLAGLFVAGESLRPLLAFSRTEVADYARIMGVRWVDDPANVSTRHLRNRVRRDLLPALARVRPGFSEELLSLARRAADWRAVLDDEISKLMAVEIRRDGVNVPARALSRLGASELALLWPSIAARAGARTDWRGIRRVVAFTHEGRVGSRIQLSGGWDVARTRDAFELRRVSPAAMAATVPLADHLVFDAWTFTVASRLGADAWTARLPGDAPLTVRSWRPGDRMRGAAAAPPRRVKRFLTDAHVSGALRSRWPVVLAGDEIVWIPGVRRGPAPAGVPRRQDRTGRPGSAEVLFRCDLNDR